ncbi:MAG: hypothetical protein WB783_06850 [Arenicellales bacterium]
MIILGNYSDKLIATELLARHREQMTIFCGVPREETLHVFQATEADPHFDGFVTEVYNRSYNNEAYESERKELIEGYTEAILISLGSRTPDRAVNSMAAMLGDDALAYYVARSAGCAYAPMNGASVNLGPKGRLFDNSREHIQAIQSGIACFSQFTLFQFYSDDRSFDNDGFARGAPGHGYEIRNNFKNYGLMIDHVCVAGNPDLEETEVQLIENNLIIRVPYDKRVSKMFSNRRVTGPHVYN